MIINHPHLLFFTFSTWCRVSGVPPGRESSEDFGGLAILAVRHSLTGSRGENLRVVGINSDG